MLAVLVTSVLGAAASSMWRLFIIIDILFVIVIYTINTFFAGNFGWSKSDRDMLMLKQDNTLPGPIMH